MIKRAILFVTFGGKRPEVLEPILDRFVSEGADRWPDRWIETVIGKENLESALENLADQGFGEVTVQPLMINNGKEYEKLRVEVSRFVNHNLSLMKVKLGRPLLWDHGDMERLAGILCDQSAPTVYVAHGTGGSSDEALRIFERKFRDRGRDDIFVRTMKQLAESQDTAVTVVGRKPLMLTAGTHARETQCEMTGLGEIPAVRAMFLDHVSAATPLLRSSNPLEALILARRPNRDSAGEGEVPLSRCSNNLGLDETKILACTDMRQALMIQELQNQELFPECELEIVEGRLEDVISMIDGLGADDCGEAEVTSEYAGLIVSYSALNHMGLERRVRAIFTPEEIVPALGAGTVTAAEGAAMQAFLYEIQEPTDPACFGEDGELLCGVPSADHMITTIYAESSDDELELWGLYYDETTGQWWTHWKIDDPAEPEVAGREFAKEIRSAGLWADGDWNGDEEDWEE